MEMIIPFGEVFLVAVIHAILQLNSGTLLLLYHSSIGKHVRKKTRYLVDSYISGIGTLIFLGLAATIFVLDRYFEKPLYFEELVIVVVAVTALVIIAWLFYHQRGKSAELWMPRSVARFINKRAKATSSNTEAFSLGVLTGLAEMPLTIVLFVVVANCILALPRLYQILAVAMYTVIAIVPPIFLRLTIRSGRMVISLQRWKVKHRAFLRLLTAVGFLALGFFLFAFEVLVQ